MQEGVSEIYVEIFDEVNFIGDCQIFYDILAIALKKTKTKHSWSLTFCCIHFIAYMYN